MQPILRRKYGTFQGASVPTSLPATQISPSSVRSSFVTNRKKVVLPEPDGPTMNTNSPRGMSTVTSRRAATEPLYVLVTWLKRIMSLGSRLENSRLALTEHTCHGPGLYARTLERPHDLLVYLHGLLGNGPPRELLE